MSFVSTAILGSGLLGAGASIFGASQQADAANTAAMAQLSGNAQGQSALLQAQQVGLNATQPFRDIGQQAGYRLATLLGIPLPSGSTNPQDAQRAQLQQQAAVAQQNLNSFTWDEAHAPLLSGPLASERRQATFNAQRSALQAAADQANNALTVFNQTNPVQTQPAQGTSTGTPGSTTTGTAATPAFTFSPIYDFQNALQQKQLAQQQAARGIVGSGTGLAQSLFLTQGLQAQDIGMQLQNLQQLEQTGASAASGQSALAGNTGASLAALLQGSGQATAQGQLGVANALAGGAGNLSNVLTGAAGLGLQNSQFNSLLSALNSRGGTGGLNTSNVPSSNLTAQQTIDQFGGSGSGGFSFMQ